MRIPVPQYQRSVDPNVTGGAALAREQPTGIEDIARGFQTVANLRERDAAIAQESFLRVEHENDKAWATERASKDRLTWTQHLQDSQTAAPPDAAGFTPKILGDFDTYRDKAVKAAPSENARKMYDGLLVGLRDHIGLSATVFESGQRRNYRKQTLLDGIDDGARTVSIDPSQYSEVRQERQFSILSSTDIPAAEKEALSQKAREEISFAAAQNDVQRDPDGFLRQASDAKLFANNPYMPDIAPQHLATLKHHAASLIAQRNGRAQTENDKAYKDAESALDEVRKFSLSGANPDLGFISTSKARTAAFPEIASQVDNLLSLAQSGAGHGSLPLPRQEDNIRRQEAVLAQGGSNPEAEKIVAYARQVTDTQKREYKENPWSAGARFARLPSVPDAPLPSADAVPDYVAQTMPLISGVETAAGQPVSPLQPAQAQKFSEQLKALPPAQRADILGRTGEQLNAPRIQALGDQLDKHDKPLSLALKLGSGRTSLDRAMAETLLRGADAIKDKTVKADDTKLSGWRSEIAGLVRGTLGDAKAEQDAIDAAYYVRAGMDEPGYPANPSNEAAVRLVLGQPLDRGGVKTVLPRGMDESTFTDKLRSFTPDALKPIAPNGEVYIRGQKRTLEQLRSSLPGMGMRRNPTGGYTPVSGGAFVTVDPEGRVPLNLQVQ